MIDVSSSSLEATAAPAPQTSPSSKFWKRALRWTLWIGGLSVFAALLWQGLTAAGNPDPTKANTSPTAAVFSIAILVFREGLECVLVLAAITANMVGPKESHKRPVIIGAFGGFLATVALWFVAVGILSDLSQNVSALNLQAATGLAAVVVLLIVMNWFFHKVYWGGWITLHNKKKKQLLNESENPSSASRNLVLGLGILGFTSLLREGVEVVLFLQSYRLQLGSEIVLIGTLIGLFFTGIVAALNFIAHRHLPYRKMLVFTGIMLGAVLLVMVGEQAQEMQLAHWIPTTPVADSVAHFMPDWMGTWFSIFPTVETLASQFVAAILVIGSFYLSQYLSGRDQAEQQVHAN